MAKAEISSSLPYIYVLSLLFFIKILSKKKKKEGQKYQRKSKVMEKLATEMAKPLLLFFNSVTFPEVIVFL